MNFSTQLCAAEFCIVDFHRAGRVGINPVGLRGDAQHIIMLHLPRAARARGIVQKWRVFQADDGNARDVADMKISVQAVSNSKAFLEILVTTSSMVSRSEYS